MSNAQRKQSHTTVPIAWPFVPEPATLMTLRRLIWVCNELLDVKGVPRRSQTGRRFSIEHRLGVLIDMQGVGRLAIVVRRAQAFVGLLRVTMRSRQAVRLLGVQS